VKTFKADAVAEVSTGAGIGVTGVLTLATPLAISSGGTGASSRANALASLLGPTVVPTFTYGAARLGSYYRLGGIVVLNVFLPITSVTGTATGSLRVNLPAGLTPLFNATGNISYSRVARVASANVLTPVFSTDGYIYITESGNNTAVANLPVSAVKANGSIHITGLYIVN
jgi:hypothetical protein